VFFAPHSQSNNAKTFSGTIWFKIPINTSTRKIATVHPLKNTSSYDMGLHLYVYKEPTSQIPNP
jgi:hypothetical protein